LAAGFTQTGVNIMTNRVLEILKAARDKIADPQHWTQNAFARTAGGQALPSNSVNDVIAHCWCTTGAIVAVAASDDGPYSGPPSLQALLDNDIGVALAMNELRKHMQLKCPGSGGEGSSGHVAYFNDTHTHAEVLHAFDMAISDAAMASG
jgi:hypothetical protein